MCDVKPLHTQFASSCELCVDYVCVAGTYWISRQSDQGASEQDDRRKYSDGDCSELVSCVEWQSQQTAGDGPWTKAGRGNIQNHEAVDWQSSQSVDGKTAIAVKLFIVNSDIHYKQYKYFCSD